MTPQQERVLSHLKKHGKIQPLEAWTDLGIYRLSDVIFKLRETYKIDTVKTTALNKYQETVKFATYVYKGVKDACN